MTAETKSEPRVRRLTEVPRFLGRYEVLFPLASGGMAEVYVARLVGEEGFSRPVAIKRMLPSLNENEHFEKMFLQEARVSANIRSPNVVQTIELGRGSDGSLFIVMELVEGVSLHRLMRWLVDAQQELALEDAVEVIHQISTGLHHAHEALDAAGNPLGIVHRDLSPQNVLVSERGRCMIVDFGVAKVLNSNELTSTGQIKGKLAYMSPEQMEGGPIDRRADVFALGIVAWELLAGRRLFKADSPVLTIRLVLEGEVPDLSTLRPDAPAELRDLVHRALARDREDRFASAAELTAAIEQLPIPRSGPSALERLVARHAGKQLAELREKLHEAATKDNRVPSTPKLERPTQRVGERARIRAVIATSVLVVVGVSVGLVLSRKVEGLENTASIPGNVEVETPDRAPERAVAATAPDSEPSEPSERTSEVTTAPSSSSEVGDAGQPGTNRRRPRDDRPLVLHRSDRPPSSEPTPPSGSSANESMVADTGSMVSIRGVSEFDRFVGMDR